MALLALAAPAGAVSGGRKANVADVPFIASLPNGCRLVIRA